MCKPHHHHYHFYNYVTPWSFSDSPDVLTPNKHVKALRDSIPQNHYHIMSNWLKMVVTTVTMIMMMMIAWTDSAVTLKQVSRSSCFIVTGCINYSIQWNQLAILAACTNKKVPKREIIHPLQAAENYMMKLTSLGLRYIVKVNTHCKAEIEFWLKSAEQMVIVAKSRSQVCPKCILQRAVWHHVLLTITYSCSIILYV